MLDWDVYSGSDPMLHLPLEGPTGIDEPGWFPELVSKEEFDEFQPMFGSEAGDGGDATDLGEVVVTGEREDDPYDEWWETGGWGSGGGPGPGLGSGGGGSGGQTANVDGLDGHQGLDCATNAIKEEINKLPTNNTNEHVAVVFRGPDGKLYTSPPFTGANGQVDYSQLGVWMHGRGIGLSDVVGLYHNHPASTSTHTDGDYHRYPSNANTVAPGSFNDWAAATGFVLNGANAATFVMILEDQNGDTRHFAYADKAKYENLTQKEMEDRKDLPPTTGSCGGG